jgi:hypothetical protein
MPVLAKPILYNIFLPTATVYLPKNRRGVLSVLRYGLHCWRGFCFQGWRVFGLSVQTSNARTGDVYSRLLAPEGTTQEPNMFARPITPLLLHRTALGNPVLPPGSTSSGWVMPPTEPYLAKSGDAADDKCRWCACETRAHLSKHCSRWKEQRVTVCREVCKATDKKRTARNTSMAWLFRDERCTTATCLEFLENTEIDLRLTRAGSVHGNNGD